MRIALAHHPVAVYSIEFTTLIARNNASRNAHSSHEHHKRRGDVFAKTGFAVKPELISGVVAIHAWL